MNKNVALVLGSGGARGTAHIGVIRELESRGYKITSISGTSMGALVGGIYAAGKLDEYEEWLISLDKRDILNLVDFTFSASGIIKANKVLKEMQSIIPDQNIEDLTIPFSAVTTDIKNKTEVVLDSGSLFEAIRASISIPMVITPIELNDTLFVDGGVLNPVPTNRVKRISGDTLIAVNVNAQIPMDNVAVKTKEVDFFENHSLNKLSNFGKKIQSLIPHSKTSNTPGYFSLINDTSSLMLAQISKLTLQLNPPDILIEISRNSCGTYDFHKSLEQIRIGQQQAIRALD